VGDLDEERENRRALPGLNSKGGRGMFGKRGRGGEIEDCSSHWQPLKKKARLVFLISIIGTSSHEHKQRLALSCETLVSRSRKRSRDDHNVGMRKGLARGDRGRKKQVGPGFFGEKNI